MKKIILLTSILILSRLTVTAQTEAETDSNTVFALVDKMPTFPGGDVKLGEFLSNNFQFTKDIKLERCFYVVIIGRNGEIVNINKLKGNPLNEEQLTSVLKKTSGMWSPPSHNGHKVIVKRPLTIDIYQNFITVKTLEIQKPN